MEGKENILLKVAAFLLIIGGVICGIISIINAAATIADISSTDSAILDSYVYAQSGGMFSGSDAIAMVLIIAVIIIILHIIMMALDVIVGAMGLVRCKQPARWRFFLVWGIVLLVIGLFGMSGGLFNLRGIFAFICGVVGPILYIVGAAQQNKAFNAANSVKG